MSDERYSPDLAGWAAPTAPATVRAVVQVPGSKSLTNRELVLAALADGPGILRAPLHSDDSARMLEALTALGVGIERIEGSGPFGDDLRITPATTVPADVVVDCGQAGTVMRFVTPLAGFARGDVTVTAHESALHRPMGEMIRTLRCSTTSPARSKR
jgi:3-phosphoshikimate 1-carboxyvinyltransferase